MKGSQAVVDMLCSQLALELTSMDVYLQQGRMLEDMGYNKLKERLVHESEDERQHADRLIQRILFLEGEPDVLARGAAKMGKTPQEMLSNDLQHEYAVAKALNEGIALCVKEGDNASRALLEELLKDTEEDHINWLESQLFLIKDVGLEMYLSEQL